MRKILLLTLAISFLQTNVKAQSVKEIEDNISYYLKNIQEKWNLYSGDYKEGRDDSLDLYNKALQKYLKDVLAKQPQTLVAKFENIGKKMVIASSEDKKFRIYSWDEEGGGSMHGYYSLIQYKTSTGVRAEISLPQRRN